MQADDHEAAAPVPGGGKCGLGFELGLALPALLLWRERRRRARRP
jgi:hypothetical protein